MRNPIPRILPVLAMTSAIFAGTAMEGVTFIPSGTTGTTTLLGPTGASVHTWSIGDPYSAFLTDSGSVVYGTGGGTGPGAPYKSVVELDWDGKNLRTWTWTSPTTGTLHHAIAIMPNGHWLALGYELLTNTQLKTAMGVTSLTYTGSVYNEHIVEYDPAAAQVVWEWDAKKHFSATASPHKINVNKFSSSSGGPGGGSSGDVLHFNSVGYDATRDVILVSAHMLNEILVIDHSTTTAQAATDAGGKFGKGGQILFRWGAPANYGGTGSTICNVIHGGNTIPAGSPGAGNYLFFCNTDNGVLNTTAKNHSAAYEIQPVVADTGFVIANGEYSATVSWNWFRNATDYANYSSSGNFGFVQRLPNGNTFVSFSKSKRLVEISDSGVVKEFTGCSSERVRASRYPLSYKGISRLTGIYVAGIQSRPAAESDIHVSSSSTTGRLSIEGLNAGDKIRMTDLRGRIRHESIATGSTVSVMTRNWTNGTYLLRVESNGNLMQRGIGIFH